ncbi:MAG: hypothetical protein ACOX6T_06940 [Myxococcales bacterium]|jgi:hypothetical protein
MRRAFPLLLLLAGCGLHRVDPAAVKALPLEARLDLLEAENELFIAVDAVDEASFRLEDAREAYRSADDRIDEAKAALGQAEKGKDPHLIEVARLAVQAAKEREAFLDVWRDVEAARLDVEKARLELAQVRFERTKALAVKRANIAGAEKLDLEDYDAAVADLEEEVKQREEEARLAEEGAGKARSRWQATRKLLAQKTGGGQGSPWVE